MMFTSRCVGLFDVISSNGKDSYVVDLVSGSCTCKGWYHKHYCKHLSYFESNRYRLMKEDKDNDRRTNNNAN